MASDRLLHWSRRSFLWALTTGVGAGLLVKVSPTLELPPPVPVLTVPEGPISLIEIFATLPTYGTAQYLRLCRRTADNPLLTAGIRPGGFYRWVAGPGQEFRCTPQEAILNNSSADLDVHLIFQQGERIWSVCGDRVTEFAHG